jgi:hypothetical protein
MAAAAAAGALLGSAEIHDLPGMVAPTHLQAPDSLQGVAVAGNVQVHRVQYASLFSKYKVECPKLFTIRRARRSTHQLLQEFQTLPEFSHRPQMFRRSRVLVHGRNQTTLMLSYLSVGAAAAAADLLPQAAVAAVAAGRTFRRGLLGILYIQHRCKQSQDLSRCRSAVAAPRALTEVLHL